MSDIPATVVVFVDEMMNAVSGLDFAEVERCAGRFVEVRAVWRTSKLPIGRMDQMASLLGAADVERLVVAGATPGLHKTFLTAAMAAAGCNPANVVLVDVTWCGDDAHGGRQRAMNALYRAIHRAADFWDEDAALSPYNPATLVIGGGIAGIQAALEIANAGLEVHLVERGATIGGHMAMFDKTFPTLDCAACILTPKMVEVGQHSFIRLMTCSEVTAVEGHAGAYTVTIHQKARRVNVTACSGCGVCAEKCPYQAPSEFEAGTALRKAIYMPFPQAVPNKYLVDPDHCQHVATGKCGACVKFCPVPGCINLDEEDRDVRIAVGNIVVATGFKPFDATRMEQFGYGRLPNVVTALEFERLVNASGPTGGTIRFRTRDKKGRWLFTPDGPQPRSVALIHCVGSRDERFNRHCSRVCCMYSLKLAHLVREKLPDAVVLEYCIDMRAYGKGYEEFYERIKGEGIQVIRGRTATVSDHDGGLLLRTEDIAGGRIDERDVDMVILAVGLEPADGAAALARLLGTPVGTDGWFTERDSILGATHTVSDGIFLAGACQGPKDIPDSVAQGSAAAAGVLRNIMRGGVPGPAREHPMNAEVAQ